MVKYAKKPSNQAAFAKGKKDDAKVHFKNTWETARVLKGMSIPRARKYLHNVISTKESVPFVKYNGGVSRKANPWGVSQVRFPKKSAIALLDVLRKCERTAKQKGLERRKLIVDSTMVQQAPKLRRRTFRAHGRINPYNYSPCHIQMIVAEPKLPTDPKLRKVSPETLNKIATLKKAKEIHDKNRLRKFGKLYY